MFVSLNSMSFLAVALPVMHLAIQNSSKSYMMLEALCHQLVGLCRFDSACVNMNMNKIHNDLSVAETVIYNLNAWLSKWNLETHQVHIDVPEDSILIEKAEYSVGYARTYKVKHFPGTLVLSKKSLEIFDAGRSLDISFAVKVETRSIKLLASREYYM